MFIIINFICDQFFIKFLITIFIRVKLLKIIIISLYLNNLFLFQIFIIKEIVLRNLNQIHSVILVIILAVILELSVRLSSVLILVPHEATVNVVDAEKVVDDNLD